MKKVLFALIIALFALPCYAEKADISQVIDNEKSNASINLNSQIKPDGNIEKQNIKNRGSWFNININRNTYKFYCKDDKNE